MSLRRDQAEKRVKDEELRNPPKKRRYLAEVPELEEGEVNHPLATSQPQRVLTSTGFSATTETNPQPSSQTSTAGIFKVPQLPVRLAKHPIVAALETHFSLIHMGQNKEFFNFFYSEVLREIAHHLEKTANPSNENEKDIYAIIKFLYEKAVIIAPQNISAKFQAESYAARFRPSPADQLETATRKARYEAECKQQGFIKFFFSSLNKYFERLKIMYGDSANQKLAELCDALNSSITMQSMRQIFMNSRKEQSVFAFTEAKRTLLPPAYNFNF